MEQFLFNHTIVIDSIMSKLQSSVELAYVKNQNFVDLIYTGFTNAQDSLYDVITSSKQKVPTWIALRQSDVNDCDVVDSNPDNDNRDNDSLKRKFLNEFSDVLLKFDTKDTNLLVFIVCHCLFVCLFTIVRYFFF